MSASGRKRAAITIGALCAAIVACGDRVSIGELVESERFGDAVDGGEDDASTDAGESWPIIGEVDCGSSGDDAPDGG